MEEIRIEEVKDDKHELGCVRYQSGTRCREGGCEDNILQSQGTKAALREFDVTDFHRRAHQAEYTCETNSAKRAVRHT